MDVEEDFGSRVVVEYNHFFQQVSTDVWRTGQIQDMEKEGQIQVFCVQAYLQQLSPKFFTSLS